MHFSEDVKYYLKILYDEYFPQHHAKKNEESGEAQRECYALMRSRCSEVPKKMSFEKTSQRDTLEKSRTSEQFLHQHTTQERKKKNETFSSFVVTFLSRELLLRLVFLRFSLLAFVWVVVYPFS
jgi:hypothetical protein